MKSRYDFFREKAVIIKNFISQSSLLFEYFDTTFFQHVSNQVDTMEQKGWSGPINSIFLFFIQDSEKGFVQTKLLERYLRLIVEHPTTTNADKSHIKGQLASENSHETLFEISILGNLLKQLPRDDIELFPRTVGKKDVEARIMLDGRWVYIDATVLNDSEGETRELTELLNKGGGIGKGMWVDSYRDVERFLRKIEYKSTQFPSGAPNVIAIALSGTRLLFIHDEWSPKLANIISNISLIMEFDRKDLKRATTENCDSSSPLTEKEIKALKKLFRGSDYMPLVYGS